MGFGRKIDTGNLWKQVNVCTKEEEIKSNEHKAILEHTNMLYP